MRKTLSGEIAKLEEIIREKDERIRQLEEGRRARDLECHDLLAQVQAAKKQGLADAAQLIMGMIAEKGE